MRFYNCCICRDMWSGVEKDGDMVIRDFDSEKYRRCG